MTPTPRSYTIMIANIMLYSLVTAIIAPMIVFIMNCIYIVVL